MLGVDVDVDSVGVKFADVLLELLQDLAQRFAFSCNQFSHEQAGEDAVFFWDVALDAEAAAFFAAGWKGTCRVEETIRKVYMIR